MAEILKETDEKPVEEIVIVDEPIEAEDDHEDTPAAKSEEDGETDAEREAIRERRRLEKLERKERREKAITRDKTELNFLRERNDALERRMAAQEQRAHESDLGTLAQQAAQARQQAEMAERVIAKAVEAGNGADVAKAMRFRDEAIQKFNQLTYVQQQAQLRPAVQAPPTDDRMMQKAQAFLKENSWYDPQGRNEESAIVLAIDQALVKDGFDPTTDEYWAELKSRAARRLPERFSKTSRGGPALGSGKEHAPVSTRTEVYLSPERKQALIDAGVWDDPVLRTKYAKRYAAYDKLHRT